MRNLNQGGLIGAIYNEVVEIDGHFHTEERWFGISADQSGDDWALRGTLNPFVATPGAGDWGAWIKVLGPDDTPVQTGMTKFDPHRILVVDVDALTPYIIQMAHGLVDAATALSAGDFTEFMYLSSTDNPSKAGGGPIQMRCTRQDSGVMAWLRVKCASADAFTFFLGIHEYLE